MRNVRMVHQSEGLAFRLEAGDHLPRTHAGLEDLERDATVDWMRLLGHVDEAKAPFADLFQELVRANDGAGSLDNRSLRQPCNHGWGRPPHKLAGLVMRLKQTLDLAAEIDITTA